MSRNDIDCMKNNQLYVMSLWQSTDKIEQQQHSSTVHHQRLYASCMYNVRGNWLKNTFHIRLLYAKEVLAITNKNNIPFKLITTSLSNNQFVLWRVSWTDYKQKRFTEAWNPMQFHIKLCQNKSILPSSSNNLQTT